MERTKRSTQTDRSFTVLTNDPSLTAWGWAVLDQHGEILEVGCIKTAPEHKKRRIRVGDDNIRRISEINLTLKHVIERYNISYMLSELPHGSQNANAAKMIGMVAAICQTISDWKDIPIEWYSEGDAKKAVLGRVSCTKREMIDAIEKLYGVEWTGIKYRDEAGADALAIHYAAMQQSNVLKFWK